MVLANVVRDAQSLCRNRQRGIDGGRRREKTLEAVRIVVTTLEAQGYRFVAAEDLLTTPTS